MTDTVLTPLAPEAANRLAGFARACKAAARAVSLYPPEHPAIESSLGRLASAAAEATQAGAFSVLVVPHNLLVDGRCAPRPDPAIAELAALLHDHLVGAMTIDRHVDAVSWRNFLGLLALDPQEVRAQGGIQRAWTTAGGYGIELEEIDYATLVQERKSGEAASWETIIANCLRTDALDLDEETLRTLMEIASDPARMTDFVARFEEQATGHSDVRSRSAALMRILKGVTEYVARESPETLDAVRDNIAQAATRLSPELMLQLLAEGRAPGTDEARIVSDMTSRMSDPMIGRFVARSVAAERGCTTRLAEAFRALTPDPGRQRTIVDHARRDLEHSAIGVQTDFEQLWSRVSDLLLSYSDTAWVSEAYNIELSAARAHSLDIEHVPDDPPERISRWLTTVSDAALRALDVQLLCDLLVVEPDGARGQELLDVVVHQVDDLMVIGDFVSARRLVDALAVEASEAESPRQRAAARALDVLVGGELMPQVASQLNSVSDEEVEQIKALCLAVGPALIPRAWPNCS